MLPQATNHKLRDDISIFVPFIKVNNEWVEMLKFFGGTSRK